MKNFRIFFLIFLFTGTFLFSEVLKENIDAEVVERVHFIFLREYDNVKDKGAIEKIVLRMGRKAYIDNLNLWKENYSDLSKINFVLHPIMQQMVKIVDRNLEPEKAMIFRKDLEGLTKIGFMHFQIYYLSLKEYVIENKMDPALIELNIFADALAKEKFVNEKLKLFDEELKVEEEIALMMKEKKVKYKIAFYSFAFKFFTDMRKNIINNEKKDMQAKLEEKRIKK